MISFGSSKTTPVEPGDDIVYRDFDNAHVFIADAAALPVTVGISDIRTIKKDAFGGAARRRQEAADRCQVAHPVAGFLKDFPPGCVFGAFTAIDHAGDGFSQFAIVRGRIVAAATDQRRQPKLLDHGQRPPARD